VKKIRTAAAVATSRIAGSRHPEDRVAVQDQVAQRAAARGGEAGEEDEAHDVELRRLATSAPVSAKTKTAA
jgi:hypothetical protein